MTIRIGRATTVRFGDEGSRALGTGGGSAQPLGALVINGTPIVLNSTPVQKAS